MNLNLPSTYIYNEIHTLNNIHVTIKKTEGHLSLNKP